MADADIVARMRLNAKDFTTEFANVVDFAEAKAKRSGAVISSAFGEQAGQGIRSLAGSVPILGNALYVLNGSALLGAAGIGAVALAIGKAISITEDYEKATRQLDAVLKATGNTTGLSAAELKEYAEQLESTLAIPAEELLKAETALSSFSGVAGSTFKRAIADAADLAAVYGGDLSSNAEKLGVVLQNLAQGNVEGLRKGFKFLGTDTLLAIEALAQMGDTAAAQTALLDALEQKVGGAGAAAAGGLSGAFFRLSDAVADAARVMVQESGTYSAFSNGFNLLADDVDRASAAVQNYFKKLDEAANPTARKTGGVVVQFTDEQKAQLAAGAARDEAKANRDAAAATEAKAKSATTAAAAAERSRKAAEAEAKARAAIRDVSGVQSDRFADTASRLTALAAANDSALEEAGRKYISTLAAGAEEVSKQQAVLAQQQADQFEYVANSFYDVLDGRGGDFWDTFGDLGKRTLAELATQFALTGKIDFGGTSAGKIAGQLGGSGGALSGLFGSGGSGIGANALTGAAGGAAAGSLVGGNTTVSAAFGVAGGVLGGAIGGPIGAAIGSALAGALGGLISKGKDPYSDTGLTTSAGGVSGSTRARGSNAAGELIADVSAGLAAVAGQFGAKVADGIKLGSIGTNKDQFYYNPGGGGFKAAGTQVFKTADEAAAAAINDALSKGALTGLSASIKNLLGQPGDLSTRIAKATQLQTALKSFDAAVDPVGAAVTALGEQFTALRDLMTEAGASTEEMAKASAAYDKQLAAIKESTTGGTGALAEFLQSLKVGSNSPLSLRDQEAAARAAYDAASGKIGTAGFDSAAFISAGRTLIDVSRQINGSTDFGVFNQVQAATNAAIAASGSGAGGDNPFIKKTADNTAATADNTSLTAELLTSVVAQLQILNAGGAAAGFIGGAARGFQAAV